MAEPTTPAEWLPVLAKRMDQEMPRIRLLKRYVDGDAPLPEADKNTREAWRRFQKQARTNWGRMIREAVADRIVPNGITIGGSSTSPEALRAQMIWRNNRMDSLFKDWVRDGLTFAESYLTTWAPNTVGDVPIITKDSPETMCVAEDPLQPWRVRAALKVWRDLDAGLDFAYVWTDGSRQKFSRSCYTGIRMRIVRNIQGDWDPVGDPVTTDGPPPVVVYRNPDGIGEFESHLDVINRINTGILHRLSIASMLAFRARALKPAAGTGGMPQKDQFGNDIDWAARLPFAPGALWDLPPGVDVWESAATDITPLLAASKDDIRQLASSTSTPLPMLMPDNANESAAGATATNQGYLSKCGDRAVEAKVGGTAALVMALSTDKTDVGEQAVDLSFEPVEMVSMAEKMAAAAQARAAGMPVKTIWRKVLGWSPEDIAQADRDLADETLTTMLGTPPGQQNAATEQLPTPKPETPMRVPADGS
ncbi:phage portal protein [Mycolicibacterium mucogenicum]|uniref:phage portal protein n=1 Tax=Mycolicibacterium mucogenicum TaxID=56689 RepID=UPI00226AA310|nr:phage portal protein [Mycolicibacterium mucogenicum]MCX8559781.1 phage portal protein [Mycolicibacterium mucogenicum]